MERDTEQLMEEEMGDEVPGEVDQKESSIQEGAGQ